MYSLHTLACNPIFFVKWSWMSCQDLPFSKAGVKEVLGILSFTLSSIVFSPFLLPVTWLFSFLFISYFKILLFVAFVTCNLKLILYFRFFWFMYFFFIFFLYYVTLLSFFVWLLFDSQSLTISKCNGLFFPLGQFVHVTFLHKLPAYLHMFILKSSFKNTFNQFPEFPEICWFWWSWCDGKVFLVYFCSCHISFFLTNQFVTALPRRPLFILLIHSFLLDSTKTDKQNTPMVASYSEMTICLPM